VVQACEQISFDDLMNRGKARDIPASDSEDMAIDNGATLKKQDLFKRDNLNKIRNFMIDYRGVDYKKKDDKDVVEDFVDQMRWFNTNMVSTAGMVRHVYNADDNQKATANEAFKLYDRLGNVFTNDGFYGALMVLQITLLLQLVIHLTTLVLLQGVLVSGLH
jgi:hypothetical protein